ncbi:polyprenol monophosphomannose synthase [Leucobacter japonicus]|uniref:polyprenol monophosphomannose synthase n=1 Tax=Leucobacter japonicus TaxID=1461259 RepID=UPI0006A7B17D|nr:polyprenol monophosphomannose synthase [Leucobacter japonicus]
MPHRAHELLVILPTYNEIASLAAAVSSVHGHLPQADIVIIDDASPDGTGALADRLASADPRVRVQHRAGKLGLGTAYVLGFSTALAEGYRTVVAMDSDGSHLASDLPALVAAVHDGAGLAIGTRWIVGGRIVNWPVYRRWISRMGTAFARKLLRSELHDLTSGFRAIDAQWLARLDLTGIDSEGYGFQIETAWQLERLGCPITEVPITFVERADGRSKMSLGIVIEAFVNVVRWGVQARRSHRSAG